MPTSTEPSAAADGAPATAAKPAGLALPAGLSNINLASVMHDLLLYGGIYLTLWAADIPAGAGWDAAIAAAPVALSQLVRQILTGVS